MLIHGRRSIVAWVLPGILALLLFYSYVLRSSPPSIPKTITLPLPKLGQNGEAKTPAPTAVQPVIVSKPTGIGRPSQQLLESWKDVLTALVSMKPDTGAIKFKGHPEDGEMDPHKQIDPPLPRPDLLKLDDKALKKLKRAHDDFVYQIDRLAPKLPFEENSKGIVMTTGSKYKGMAIASLMMLRRTGSTLPVQIFFDSSADYDEDLCLNTFANMNVECRIMEDVWKATPKMPKLEKFQFKVFSIMFSSFQEVMFLDADCWPMNNPDHLLDSAPFTTHGFVTFPDLWLPTVSPNFYKISGVKKPEGIERRTSESGILLYNKATHARSLLLAAYYNFYGPDYYWVLLSQNAHGQGDKETFLHAAMAMGDTFYDVKTNLGFLGRWLNGSFEAAGMKQADPTHDYKLTREPPKMQPGNKKPEPVHADWLFIHQNLVKIDIGHLSDLEQIYRKDENGQMRRIWGDDQALSLMVGYDVERALWQTILDKDCGEDYLPEECDKLKAFFNEAIADPEEEYKPASA